MVNNQEFTALVDRMARMEELLGAPPESSVQVAIFQRIRDVELMLGNIHTTVEEVRSSFEGMPSFVEDEVSTLTQVVDVKLENVLDELRVVKRALRNIDEIPVSKVRVPEPKPFEGARSSKELENFLWDMETYFRASHIPDAEKVSITGMYLAGDAKLWWRTRLSDDTNGGRGAIETWDALKKELKEQFLPCNTSWIARESLRRLKHSGTIRAYVKEFSSLLLDVREMSDEDKLFNFLSGLQPWAQTELRRQGVKDLQSAIAAADGLVDYNNVGKTESELRKNSGKGKDKGKFVPRGKRWADYASDTDSDGGPTQKVVGKKKTGCFICNGDHRMKDCPKKGKLNALVAESEADEEAVIPRMSPLQLLTAMQRVGTNHNGLMYVKTVLNGKEVMAMVDTGATHNFIASRVVPTLGLDVLPDGSRIKAANSEAKPIQGRTEVDMQIGSWSGRCSLMAATLDDFDLILGIEFLVAAKVAVMPHVGGMWMMDESCPSFVKCEIKTGKVLSGLISAQQPKKGVQREASSSLAAMTCVESENVGDLADIPIDRDLVVQVNEKGTLAKKGDYPATTRTSSGFGAGGLLPP